MTQVVGLDKFHRHVAAFPKHIRASQVAAVGQASLAVKTAVMANMAGVSRLSGVGRAGAKVGVRYDIRGTTSLVRATGPFHLLERDTKAHEIPKAGRRRRRNARNLLVIGGEVRTGPVQHPGTKGKHPWRKGVAQSAPLVRGIFRREFRRSLARSFGG